MAAPWAAQRPVRWGKPVHGCAGRHGGGEFAVACSHTLPAEALRIRKRIETLRPAAGIGLSPAERRHRTLRGWTHG